jgi:transcriptional regulator with GAF, ATPase, and Fis domain
MFVRDASGAFRLIGLHSDPGVPTSLPGNALANDDQLGQVIQRVPSSSRETMPETQQLLRSMNSDLLCTLRDERGVDGMIFVGRRITGTPYSAEDIAFLQAIGQMTVLALHSSRANQNLARLTAELKVKVDRIAEQQRQLAMLRAELTSLQDADNQSPAQNVEGNFDRVEIRGNSDAIQEVLSVARKAASSAATVLIRGESGTGKELLARVIHRNSERSQQPLISVNCAALAPSLLESELFGHVRGAFTGAHSDKIGRFQAADGGTLFLDEIGDISLETQVKLLRVLQERSFEPVGSNESIGVDVRLIAATHRNLEQMIADGRFREDLYYRLNVISVTLPALRNRREDLIELVFFFLNRALQKTRKRIRQIEPDALALMEQHGWPGNIRELENAVERAVVLAEGDTITISDLPKEIQDADTRMVARDSKHTSPVSRQPIRYEETDWPDQEPTERTESEDDEVANLVNALELAEGNKARAARLLNLPRSTFYSKLKKYGIGE